MNPASHHKGRREDVRFLTGQGRYTDDWRLEGQLYAAFRRADRAHALIKSINTSAAERSDGVVAVFTGHDLAAAAFRTLPPIVPFAGRGGRPVIVPERPILARDKVCFAGEEIAVVVARTRSAATDAAELIEIEYEDLAAVIGVRHAVADGAPQIHTTIPGNVCFDFEYGDEAKVAAAFAAADLTVKLQLESPRVAPNPMEPRGVLVSYDAKNETYDVYCGNQGTFAIRDSLSVMTGVPADKIKVRPVDVGGAFGARTVAFPEHAILMYVCKVLGPPVKWLSTRSEDFLTDNHGRAVSLEGELALSKRGKFLGLKTQWLCDSGAYLTNAGILTNSSNGMAGATGVYDIPAVYGRHLQIITNTAPTNAYRGAGRPEASLLIESLVDEAAVKLGMDPLKLRRRNLVPREQMPYRTATGAVIDSSDFRSLIDKAEHHSDWKGFAKRRRAARKAGKLRGIGVSVFLEPSGGGAAPEDQVAIHFDRDGRTTLYCTAGASGQGHETVFPQMVAAWLGLDPDDVVLKAGDPDGPALRGSPAIGSRTGMLIGSVFRRATEHVIGKATELAAAQLEVDPRDLEFASGRFTVQGTDRSIALKEIIRQSAGPQLHPLNTLASLPISRAFPSGAHIVEIEIDPETGNSEIVRYTAVDDIGTVINPQLAEGQIFGGIVQSAGQVFGEHCSYDEHDGQLRTGSFMDYVMPRAKLVREVSMHGSTVVEKSNLIGAKGAGETGTTGALPACMNAIADALRSAGVTKFDMPATPSRIWQALNRDFS